MPLPPSPPALQAPAPEALGPLRRFRAERLRELGLPDDKVHAVVERWARFDRDTAGLFRDQQRLRSRFHEILLGPGSEEDKNARIRPLVDQFMENRRRQLELRHQFEEDLRVGLSPAQQARMILMIEDLLKEVRRELGGVRSLRR